MTQKVDQFSSYRVATVANADGDHVQQFFTPPYPEVPLATQVDIEWVGGNPTTFTYKNASGTTLATKTITWTDGNPTNEAWT